MSEDVIGYLESKGIHLKRGSGHNRNCSCFFHGEDESDRGRLYINVDPDAEIPGLFQCFVCDEHGSLNKIKRHFGDDPTRPVDLPRAGKSHRVLQEAAEYYHQLLLAMPEKLSWLQNTRGLTLDTIKKHKLGWADGNLNSHFESRLLAGELSNADLENSKLFRDPGQGSELKPEGEEEHKFVLTSWVKYDDFLRNCYTIPYFSYGACIYIRGRPEGKGAKYLTPSGVKTRLYNSDSLLEKDDRQVIICEGEFDALVAEQLGYRTVGVPGANTWQEDWNRLFVDVPRVFAVYDNDDAGRKGLKKVSDNLGTRVRTLHVPHLTGPEDHNDITGWVVEQGHTKEDFQRLLQKSTGGLIVTVDDAFQEHAGLQDLEGLKLGLPSLDPVLHPGLLPSQVMIVLAKTGVGKTISLLNIFHRAALEQPDAKMLFVSLEQTRGDWFERARRIFAFHNFRNDAPLSMDPIHLKEFNERVNEQTLDFWRDRFLMMDKNRVSEDELVSAIQDFDDMMGEPPSLIAVDYLGYWASGFEGRDKYQKTTDAVMSLKAVAKDWRVPIIAPHQVNRMAEFGQEPDVDAARDSGAVEETGDFVMLLWSPDNQKEKEVDERTGEVLLKVGKSRHGGKGMKQRMAFGPLTLTLTPLEEQDHIYAAREIDLQATNRTVRWEEAIYHHHQHALRNDGVF